MENQLEIIIGVLTLFLIAFIYLALKKHAKT
jgi:cbb3-type cytochrome oxidase subunit 3